jgi:hypothetical protein
MEVKISVEVFLTAIGLVVGATVWVVSAIYSVRNSFEKFAAALSKDVQGLERRVGLLEDND